VKHTPFEYRQRVRLQAAEMFEKGRSDREMAIGLGTTRKTVSLWRRDWRERGTDGLTIGTPGRKARLTEEQWQEIAQALLEGPRAQGYETELWSLGRIADLIHRKTGVSYHPCHVWKLLKRLNWSWQKPERRAKERDEEEIARWKAEEWPRIKRGSKRKLPR